MLEFLYNKVDSSVYSINVYGFIKGITEGYIIHGKICMIRFV